MIAGEYDVMFVVGKTPIPYLESADCPTNTIGCIAGDPTTLPIKLVPIQAPDFLVKATLLADTYPWMKAELPNSVQATSFFAFSPNLSLDKNHVADLINAMYTLKADDTTSLTWMKPLLNRG